MKTRNESGLYIGRLELSRVIKWFAEFFFGFFLSAVSFGGLYPFGLAYCAVSKNSGVLGVLLGYFIFSSDSYRYIFACLFCFLLKRLIGKKIPVNGLSGTFFFIVWGTLLAEILGILTVEYTFTENMLFALSGIIAGVCGTVYFYANIKTQKSSVQIQNVVFFCKSVLIASVLTGLAHAGDFALAGSYIFALLTVFLVGRSAGILKCFAVGLIIDIFYMLTGLFSWSMLGSIAACVAVVGLLRELPRYFTAAACMVASLLILIYEQGNLNAWFNLLCIVVAGAVYVSLPGKALDLLYEKSFFRQPAKHFDRGTRIKAKKSYRSDVASDINPVCDSCSKKLICWVRDHDYTADVFLKLKNTDFARIPSHFEEHCDHIGELMNVIGKPKEKNGCKKVLVSKGSSVKRGEKISGDNAMTFVTDENKHVVCLLDGMGSGIRASKQSSDCAAVLRKLLERGVDKKEAVHFLNEQLSNGDHEAILGVDLMIVDLEAGYIETYKAGVSPTYIIRNGKIYEFGASSLPIGVLDDIYAETNRCRIRAEDIVIMVSDGFFEKGSEWLGRRLADYVASGTTSCVDITEKLIEEGCAIGLDVYDDLTAVAVKIL